MSILLSVLFVGLALAHRHVHQGQDGDQFEESLHMTQMINATAADECPEWCEPVKQITWDHLCSYNSGACKACPQCKSRCEPWCSGKIGLEECGERHPVSGRYERTCTQAEVCRFGNGVKCSECDMCKEPQPISTELAKLVTGCESWCKDKVGQTDQKQSVLTWGKICTWTSGKCSKCPQCPTADPTCSLGVTSKLGGSMQNVCCKHTCGKNCGGPDCSKLGRDSADCCGEKIKSAKKSCKANLPPCVLESQKGGNNGSNSVKIWKGVLLTILMALAVAA